MNIDVSGTGQAAVSTGGDGDVTIELEGKNTVQSGSYRAGVEKNNTGSLTITDTDNDGNLTATGGYTAAGIGGGNRGGGSDITISGGTINATGGDFAAGIGGGVGGNGSNIIISGGDVTATGNDGGAGIGGGEHGSGSNITISDGKVTANGGIDGAGIGGGNSGNGIGGGIFKDGSDITVSGDAQVKVQGGNILNNIVGAGAPIGNGGDCESVGEEEIKPIGGAEVKPDVSELTPAGKIEYYAPGTDMEKDDPTITIEGTYVPDDEIAANTQSAPLYRVTDKDGRGVNYKAERKDGVLTVTVDADFAVLTGTLGGISTLKAQGVEKIVFVTKGAKSTFALADLLEKGSTDEAYKLTHDGKTVTFTLGAKNTDVSDILKKA